MHYFALGSSDSSFQFRHQIKYFIFLFFSDTGDYEFTSTGTVAELKFDVVNMSAVDDFRSFGFEASVEFVRLEALCESSHKVYGASGDLRLSSSAPMADIVSS